jgi:hypothetical protein
MGQKIISELYDDKSKWAKRLWELLALVVIAGALFGWGAWVGYRAHPAPKSLTINGNSTAAEDKKADYALGVTNKGSGHSNIKLTSTAPIGEDEHSFASSQNDPWNVSQGLFNGQDQLPLTAWTGRGELKGDVLTTIVDKRSGKILWSGKSDLTGEAMATVTGDQLALDVTWLNNQSYAVDLPKEKPKRWEVGAVAGIATDGDWFAGGYGRCNVATLNIGRFEASPWIGAAGLQTNDGPEGIAMVGISGRF